MVKTVLKMGAERTQFNLNVVRGASLLFALVAVITTSSVGSAATPEKPGAEKAAQSWLKLLDQNSYDECWKQTADFFKSRVPQTTFAASFKTVREPFGKLLTRKLKSKEYLHSMPGAPDGNYCVLRYNAVYEKKAHALETVTPMLEGGSWKVSGYVVR